MSAGNVTLLSPAGVLLVLCLLGGYQYCTGRYIPRTYSAEEKDGALQALAVALLLVRDKRVKARTAKADAHRKKPESAAKEEQSMDLDSYDVGLLADLVEQLGNIAPAAERHDYLYREEVGEPVTINWQQLSSKIVGSGKLRSRSQVNSSASRDTLGTEMIDTSSVGANKA